MPSHGHCNCGSVGVTLKQEEQNLNSLLCYCRNCVRSGGGYSVNYTVSEEDADIKDPQSTLNTYIDSNTASGNSIKRQFCGRCGSAVATRSPKLPGMVLIKASLFDRIAHPTMELHTHQRQSWQPAVQGAKQL
ncbi:hypothetical protein AJ79_04382 [Helicocarpus griseus UAMH5409]|uniref:CENP-V/GFA domain-containing protein n=1 Tax=Helicocarpus griseus UAMH5409 TaxID=1447875 RepID=A0A2B7XSY7_9EURO|nr:hypothetical protein AJ79_04382 [Helicocarpus griseus UAMH5409]